MARFYLERFYYGQIIQAETTPPDSILLAASEAISPEIAGQAVERLRIPPLTAGGNRAWALVRGRNRNIPFLMVQSQRSESGAEIMHYIIFQPDALRAFGGNLQALQRLIQAKLPIFSEAGGVLKPLDVIDPTPLSVDVQIDHILELMTVTGNKTAHIAFMLGAIVQGVPLYVLRAPHDFDKRVVFLQGLLALLPASARFGVTFTTHSLAGTQVDTQIRFYDDNVPPPDGVAVFDWASANVSGVTIQDNYSQFMISQLRLDAELVIRHGMAMASIAGWRLNQGDNLAESLAYASLRLKVDAALTDNQPVNKEDVAHILTEDPTLPPDMQIKYALHLLRLGLAMRDLSPAEPIAILLRNNEQLERAVFNELNTALSNETAPFIHSTLIRWMNNPLGPQGFRWVDLTHRTTLTHLQSLTQANASVSAIKTLQELQDAGIVLQLDELAPKIIKLTLPLSYADSAIAENLFLLGVRYLSADAFQQLLAVERFRDQLNPNLTRVWTLLRSDDQSRIDSTALLNVSRLYGERWETPILIRLCETAQINDYYALFDEALLKSLFDVANTAAGREYADQIRSIIRTLEAERLVDLDDVALRYILQIHLALGDYDSLARGMLRHLKKRYLDDQERYLMMVSEVFTGTQIPLSRVNAMIEQINAAGVRSTPYLVAMASVIQGHRGEIEVEAIAERAVRELEANRFVVDLIPPSVVFGLLDHYNLRRDIKGMRSVLGVIPIAIRGQGAPAIRLAAEAYRKAEWSADAQAVGLDVLRAAVRLQPPENARKAADFFTKQFGVSVQRPLNVTHLSLQLTGYRDIDTYAEMLTEAVAFLQKMVAVYTDDRQVPAASLLLQGLGTISGGAVMREQQRTAFLDDVLNVGQGIVRLARQYRAGRNGDENTHAKIMVGGRGDPLSTLDIVRVMSGGLVAGKRATLNITPQSPLAPLEGFSMGQIRSGFERARAVILPLAEALPLNKPSDIKARDLVGDMRSFAVMLDDEDMVRRLGRDWQYLVDLIVRIDATGDAKAFTEGSFARRLEAGKQKPRGALELMRFMYGFYQKR